MNYEEQKSQVEHCSHDDGHGKDMVAIYVNDMEYLIHRGRQAVTSITQCPGVPSRGISLNQGVFGLYPMPTLLLR